MAKVDQDRLGTGDVLSNTTANQFFDKSSENNEDEDAMVYRRAKQSVDELHRARQFEKSIKLK